MKVNWIWKSYLSDFGTGIIYLLEKEWWINLVSAKVHLLKAVEINPG